MTEIEIRPALRTDVESIRKLGDKVFGSGYLDSWILPKSGPCLVAVRGTNLVGMISFTIEDIQNPQSATLSLLMVDVEHRRQGIGAVLYEKGFQALLETGTIHATCWKESPNSGIIEFLENRGWKELSSVERYWYQDSIDKGYQCARCDSRCFCTAVLMSVTLPDIVQEVS
jgi:GNAT superfamily N-acetyltransferase